MDVFNKSSSDSIVEKLRRLREAVGVGPVLIMTHEYPDPDALASGLGLSSLLASWGLKSDLVYSGLVNRAENRTMLSLLTPEWVHDEDLPYLDEYSAIALVDTQPNAGNNILPPDVIPHVVIDHHHPERDIIHKVPFVELRPEVGATASLVYQFLEAAAVKIDARLATAIFYGIKTDTRGLSRGDSPVDQRVYFNLLTTIDRRVLAQVEQAGLPREYFRSFCAGLQAAIIYGNVVIADLGVLHRPDFVGEMADLLVRVENAIAVLCLGKHKDVLYLSIRTVPLNEDAGLLIQRIVPAAGKAGGHGTMAAGQIHLKSEGAGEIVSDLIDRFLTVMNEDASGEPLMA